MTSASLMHEAGHSKPMLWDNSEGWSKEGSGGGGSGWLDTCVPMADSYRCMAKTTTILQSNYLPIKVNYFSTKFPVLIR